MNLPKGLLITNVLAKAASSKVPVRAFNLSGNIVKLMPRSRVAIVY